MDEWLTAQQNEVIVAVISAAATFVLAWVSGLARWFFGLFRAKPAEPSSITEGIDVLARRLMDQSTKLGAAGEREQRYKDKIATQDSEINALRGAIEALEKQQGDPRIDERRDKALALLVDGNTSAAEEIFEEILEAKSAAGAKAKKEAAEAARHLGALAFLHDTQKAIDAYIRATELDTEEPDAWIPWGLLRLRVGELSAAEAAFERVLTLSHRTTNKALAAAATGNLGLIHQTRGDLDKAEAFMEQSLELNEAVGSKEGMAAATGNLGQLRREQGDIEAACRLWAKSHALLEEIGAADRVAQIAGWMTDAGCGAPPESDSKPQPEAN